METISLRSLKIYIRNLTIVHKTSAALRNLRYQRATLSFENCLQLGWTSTANAFISIQLNNLDVNAIPQLQFALWKQTLIKYIATSVFLRSRERLRLWSKSASESPEKGPCTSLSALEPKQTSCSRPQTFWRRKKCCRASKTNDYSLLYTQFTHEKKSSFALSGIKNASKL